MVAGSLSSISNMCGKREERREGRREEGVRKEEGRKNERKGRKEESKKGRKKGRWNLATWKHVLWSLPLRVCDLTHWYCLHWDWFTLECVLFYANEINWLACLHYYLPFACFKVSLLCFNRDGSPCHPGPCTVGMQLSSPLHPPHHLPPQSLYHHFEQIFSKQGLELYHGRESIC